MNLHGTRPWHPACRDEASWANTFRIPLSIHRFAARLSVGGQRQARKTVRTLRLTIHEAPAQVIPCTHGIPWLGFVVYPTHRRIKSRNVVKFSRKLKDRWAEYCAGNITFAEFDASVKGWVNHVRYADTWGLRPHLLGQGLVFKKPIFEK